jgi:uncharacterized protein
MRRHFLTLLLVLFNVAAAGQPQRGPFTPPDDIDYRKAGIMSEGTRMAAELFAPKSLAGQALPTILMAHGWGGTAAQLRIVGLEFARAGYFVVTFDYRGWGQSDSRLILTGPAPAEKKANRFSVEVQEVREVVDPLDMTTDWLNALHWLQGEPQCDKARIGLWGTSYSGGHVVYVAARDPRVKAIVSQVGSLDSRFMEPKLAYEEGTKRARGDRLSSTARPNCGQSLRRPGKREAPALRACGGCGEGSQLRHALHHCGKGGAVRQQGSRRQSPPARQGA